MTKTVYISRGLPTSAFKRSIGPRKECAIKNLPVPARRSHSKLHRPLSSPQCQVAVLRRFANRPPIVPNSRIVCDSKDNSNPPFRGVLTQPECQASTTVFDWAPAVSRTQLRLPQLTRDSDSPAGSPKGEPQARDAGAAAAQPEDAAAPATTVQGDLRGRRSEGEAPARGCGGLSGASAGSQSALRPQGQLRIACHRAAVTERAFNGRSSSKGAIRQLHCPGICSMRLGLGVSRRPIHATPFLMETRP
jgi:hypothetical protein